MTDATAWATGSHMGLPCVSSSIRRKGIVRVVARPSFGYGCTVAGGSGGRAVSDVARPTPCWQWARYQVGRSTTTSLVDPSICQACQVVVGPGLPHHRLGMPAIASGTSARFPGTGQVWVHLLP